MQSTVPAPSPAVELTEPKSAAPRSERADASPSSIVALSDDPNLLGALEGATRAHAAVIISPSADRFVDQLVATAASIALIDATSAPAPLKAFLALLREQFPHLLLIVAGPAQLQHQFGEQLAEGTIFRFVHKPASSARLKLFIDAALRRQEPEDVTAEAVHPDLDANLAAPRRRRRLGWAALGLAALAALFIAWTFGVQLIAWNNGVQTRSGAHPAAPVPEPVAIADAPAAAEQVKVQPPMQALPQEAAPPAQAQSGERDTRAARLGVYLQLARERLASSALLDPADDSARAYLDLARALAPDDAEVRATAIALGTALIAQFRHALSAGDAAAAQRWLQACNDFKINPATLGALAAQLAQFRGAAEQRVEAPSPALVPGTTP